jgi:hypothetical protein
MSLAFSLWIRSAIGFATGITIATIAEYTYAHQLWLWIVGKQTPDKLYDSMKERVDRIYSRTGKENASLTRMAERKKGDSNV